MGLMDRLKQLVYLRLTPQGNRAGSTTPADDDLVDDYSRDIARALANAYRHPVVCIALAWLTKQASSTPYILERQIAGQDVEEIVDHPLLSLLNKPSDFLSGRELLAVSTPEHVHLRPKLLEKRKDTGRRCRLSEFPFSAGELPWKGDDQQLITHYEYRPFQWDRTTREI